MSSLPNGNPTESAIASSGRRSHFRRQFGNVSFARPVHEPDFGWKLICHASTCPALCRIV